MRSFVLMAALAGLAFGWSGAAAAQQSTPATPLAVGEVAPDFAIPGATRYGVLRDPVRLSEFRGKTVVLAFFFRARTPG
jgi:cytochrome oxidase Cu insertion factor (SCO1/SenC/PrrC family)